MRSSDLTKLSRTVARLLRHEPWSAGLELDDEGWGSADALVQALRRTRKWSRIDRRDLVSMIERSDKARFEIRGDRIRALYGHSFPRGVTKAEARPPEFLWHGTAQHSASSITSHGLRPMKRQFVHLSADVSTAQVVGKRKSSEVVVLRIRAREAHDAGVRFYPGNEIVWLAESVPAEFIDD